VGNDYFTIIASISIFFLSCSQADKKQLAPEVANNNWTVYSTAVQDSFVISIQLPEEYGKDTSVKYPTVYMLDANFHFPILAATVKQYEKAGMLPPIILVGIGYKSFQLMDSLRNRDYLYPAALPSDEINAVGGGQKFNDFISNQLIPYIDSSYKTNKTNRSLLGHSFGGYFTLYALLNQIENNKSVFTNFAAASPSLWYSKFYLNQLTNKLKSRGTTDTLNVFATVGGLENTEWDITPGTKLSENIANAKLKAVKFQHKIYSNLGHMDVSTITFIQALQTFYNREQ
jgi:predicted alpha/beta superfamily hydrolase